MTERINNELITRFRHTHNPNTDELGLYIWWCWWSLLPFHHIAVASLEPAPLFELSIRNLYSLWTANVSWCVLEMVVKVLYVADGWLPIHFNIIINKRSKWSLSLSLALFASIRPHSALQSLCTIPLPLSHHNIVAVIRRIDIMNDSQSQSQRQNRRDYTRTNSVAPRRMHTKIHKYILITKKTYSRFIFTHISFSILSHSIRSDAHTTLIRYYVLHTHTYRPLRKREGGRQR